MEARKEKIEVTVPILALRSKVREIKSDDMEPLLLGEVTEGPKKESPWEGGGI